MYSLGLIVLFVGLPLLELWLLLKLHEAVDLLATLMIVVLTGVVGASLARFQGMLVLGNIRRDLAAGNMPAPYLMDGLMILIAGALLITPGLITDTVGFALLIPAFRKCVKGWLSKWLETRFVHRAIDVDHWEC